MEIEATVNENLTTQSVEQQNDPIVQNVTPFSKETLNKYFKDSKRATLILIICGSILLIIGILGKIFLSSEDFLDSLFYNVLIFGGIFSILMSVICFLGIRNSMKNPMLGQDTRNVLTFYENEFVCQEFSGEKQNSEHTLNYTQIVKVTKQKDIYVLRVGNLILLLAQEKFTIGTEEKFCKLLKEKCNKNTVKIK
ncbi:MAG: hypothetical protein IJ329_01570 [Clostridia bacterium]|nr:hypothetical protein [Clostridia bacterium]